MRLWNLCYTIYLIDQIAVVSVYFCFFHIHSFLFIALARPGVRRVTGSPNSYFACDKTAHRFSFWILSYSEFMLYFAWFCFAGHIFSPSTSLYVIIIIYHIVIFISRSYSRQIIQTIANNKILHGTESTSVREFYSCCSCGGIVCVSATDLLILCSARFFFGFFSFFFDGARSYDREIIVQWFRLLFTGEKRGSGCPCAPRSCSAAIWLVVQEFL